MDVTMSYDVQTWWTWWFAIYLFFGGLGAAVMAVAFLTDMYYKKHPTLVIWGMISSIVMLGAGSGMLFLHLLHHLAVVNVLNPMVLLRKPDAWIAWGTQFITWMMVWGVLYPLPYLIESPTFLRLPVLKNVLRWKLVHTAGGAVRALSQDPRLAGRHQRHRRGRVYRPAAAVLPGGGAVA